MRLYQNENKIKFTGFTYLSSTIIYTYFFSAILTKNRDSKSQEFLYIFRQRFQKVLTNKSRMHEGRIAILNLVRIDVFYKCSRIYLFFISHFDSKKITDPTKVIENARKWNQDSKSYENLCLL